MEELHYAADAPGLRISYDDANDWLYSEWWGEHDEASIKLGAHRVYACLAVRPCAKIFSNHSGLTGDWQDVSQWIRFQYFDYLTKHGIQHFAWVHAAGYADRSAMEHARAGLSHPIVDVFGDIASAYDWLQRCAVRP